MGRKRISRPNSRRARKSGKSPYAKYGKAPYDYSRGKHAVPTMRGAPHHAR